jgi:hypothetical protein
MDADGDFLVAWTSYDQDGSGAGVYRQSFNAAGVPQGEERRVNTFTTDAQRVPVAAMDADGDAVIAWQSSLQDLSSEGVYAQRFGNFPGTPFPAGTEFKVNTFTTGGQGGAAIASDADGDFAVVWFSAGQDGSSNSIHGQRYSSSGVPQGAEFLVNSTTLFLQISPSVAMDAAGNFVVVWFGNGVGDGDGVFARRYDVAGVAQGLEFKVNTHTTDRQDNPSIAMDAVGNFVVAWESDAQDGFNDGIYAQRFDASGVAQGSEFRVNTFTPQSQFRPATAMDSDGDFVVGWISQGQVGSPGIYAQRYAANGAVQGGEFRVSTTTAGGQNTPTVAMDADGDFVFAWDSPSGPGDPSYVVYAQRYSTAGQPRGHQFRVNSFTSDIQAAPSVAMNADGDFVIAWTSVGQDQVASGGVYLQRFNAAGQPQGVELRVNTTTTDDQGSPVVAMSVDKGLIIAWSSDQDDPSDVFAQRYTLPATAPVVVASSFVPEPLPNRLRFTFSQNISASLDTGDIVLENLSTSQTIPSADLSVSFDLPSGTATIAYTGAAGGTSGVLPAGDYRLTLDSSDITNGAGTPMGADHVFTFAVPLTVPLGSEFRVNTTIFSSQNQPSTARNADGDFVVVWTSFAQDGNVHGIYAQRFDDRGTWLGDEFRVNTFTTGSQLDPSVAMDSSGNFVVTWSSFGQDGSGSGVYAQRYNADGVAQGDELRVNTVTADTQRNPSIAMDSDGDFVIAWEGYVPGDAYGIFAQRYNAAGSPQGGEFLVNTFTTGTQGDPVAAMDADGDFVLAWMSDQEDGSQFGVYAQRYNAAGVAQGGEFRVDTFTAGSQFSPGAVIDASGNFVVAWTGQGADDASGVFAQRYNASGVPQGEQFRVNTTVDEAQMNPSIAMSPAGRFLITWEGSGDGGVGVIGKLFSASGVAIGDELLVSSFTSSVQSQSTAVLNADGSFVVAWESSTQDPDGSMGVYARRFGVPVAPTVSASSFLFETAPHRLQFTFSDNVSASLGTQDLVLENLTTAQTIPSAQLSLQYDPATNTATFTFTGVVTNILPDGNYRATLLAAGIANNDGTPMAANHVFNFFFLNGDANRDQRVNLQDFNIVAANFGQSPRNFSQGDFTYDTIVNLADFNILASRFGQVLAAPAGARSLGMVWESYDRHEDDLIREFLA